jgi:carboxyl-terminal processing protease
VARWLTPDGRNVHGQGLAPDVPVTLTEEDRAAGRDPQLAAALQQLQQTASR